MAKRELLATIRDRYLVSSRKDQSRIRDDLSRLRVITASTASGNWPSPRIAGRRMV